MPQRSKPSAKLDPSQSETLSHRRTKRLRIDSDEDEDEGYEQQERHTGYSESYARGHDSPDTAVARKRPRHIAGSQNGSDSDNGDGECDYPVDEGRYDEHQGDGEHDTGEYGRHEERPGKRRRSSTLSPPQSSPPPTNLAPLAGQVPRTRRASIKASTSVSVPATKKSTVKGKQKADKRRKKLTEGEDDEEDYEDEDESEGEAELDEDEEDDEAMLSDEYEEEEDKRPSRGKRGRTGGRGGQGKEKAKEKDVAPILKKAKFEGSTAVSSTGGAKRLRTKRGAEDVLVDVVGDSGTPEPSSIGSPTTINPTVEGNKDDSVSASTQPPPKKPKLPTIKKLKTAANTGGGTGPSTPTSVTGVGGKTSTLPPPPTSGGAGNKLGISESTKPARPKTNTTSDLDLSNPSLYAELFKNPVGNASKTGLNRRAKEEERRRELDKMRDEYKTRFMEEAKVSFDLQGQADKIARFEEVLRRRHSSALYPNFLAAKWREEWEREKRRAHKREYQQHQLQNVNADDAKEEGEM